MASPIKEYIHYCKYCNKLLLRKRFDNGRLEDFNVFKKRKYCNRECMRKNYIKVGNNYNQKYRVAHQTAKKINEVFLKRTSCEKCNKNGKLDVHHIDGNFRNNTINNLMVLCRSCHMKLERNSK